MNKFNHICLPVAVVLFVSLNKASAAACQGTLRPKYRLVADASRFGGGASLCCQSILWIYLSLRASRVLVKVKRSSNCVAI
jgi:hypothetical protein